jgi:hypothetical protein
MERHSALRHGLLGLALAFASSLPSAFADPVITLFSTGGTPGGADSHYTITAGPTGSFPVAAQVTTGSPGTYPFDITGGWDENDSDSQWISPQATYSSGTGDLAGNWTFQTTFNLSAYDKSTLLFTEAEFWASSTVTQVLLNGNDISIFAGGDPSSPTSFLGALTTAVNGGAGLLTGVNTLTFVVANQGTGTTPTGLRVNIAATADAVPEPASIITLALVGATILVSRRERRTRITL